MDTSPTNNGHTLSQMILWQYEHSPNIVRWIRELSISGYNSCGKVFDDIIDGMLSILSNVNTIGMWIAQTLIASKGFNWKDSSIFSVSGHEVEFLRAFYFSRFIGVGNLDEFYRVFRTFGRSDFVDFATRDGPVDVFITDNDGALIRLDDNAVGHSMAFDGDSDIPPTAIQYLVKKGLPRPLSIYCDFGAGRPSEDACFEFGKAYKPADGTLTYNPMRLCTDDEKSFYKINGIDSSRTTVTVADVQKGNVFKRRRRDA